MFPAFFLFRPFTSLPRHRVWLLSGFKLSRALSYKRPSAAGRRSKVTIADGQRVIKISPPLVKQLLHHVCLGRENNPQNQRQEGTGMWSQFRNVMELPGAENALHILLFLYYGFLMPPEHQTLIHPQLKIVPHTCYLLNLQNSAALIHYWAAASN